MEAKNKIPNNINTNHNTNNVNVNVNVEHPKTEPSQKKSTPTWYTRTIIGGIITLALSLCGYFVKKNMDAKSVPSTTKIEQNVKPIESIKQN